VNYREGVRPKGGPAGGLRDRPVLAACTLHARG
jgi:hypothetical protein